MSAGRHSPEVARLKRRIRTLDAEFARVAAQLFDERVERANNWARAARLIAWIQDVGRKPANVAFTEGPERQVAYTIEMLGFRPKEQK